MYIGIDPGRDKCGVAVLNSVGKIFFQQVVATENLSEIIKKLSDLFDIELAILGDGTTHKSAEKILKEFFSVRIVDEKHTTELARKIYWQKNPPQGWRKLLPTSLQVPPEPVDAIVAEILVKRFLDGEIAHG